MAYICMAIGILVILIPVNQGELWQILKSVMLLKV
jgi:hypothetical protein